MISGLANPHQRTNACQKLLCMGQQCGSKQAHLGPPAPQGAGVAAAMLGCCVALAQSGESTLTRPACECCQACNRVPAARSVPPSWRGGQPTWRNLYHLETDAAEDLLECNPLFHARVGSKSRRDLGLHALQGGGVMHARRSHHADARFAMQPSARRGCMRNMPAPKTHTHTYTRIIHAHARAHHIHDACAAAQMHGLAAGQGAARRQLDRQSNCCGVPLRSKHGLEQF